MAVLNKTALRSLLSSFTGLQDTSTTWELDAWPTISDTDAAQVVLRVLTMSANGIADSRTLYTPGVSPPTTATFESGEIGNRNITVSVRCRVYDASAEASEILDSVRTRLHLQTTSDALNAMGLAWQGCEATQDVSYTQDNRYVNMASMDIKLSGLGLFDLVQTGSGWVDTVNSATSGSIPGSIG